MSRPRSSLALTVPRRRALVAPNRPAPRHARAFGRARPFMEMAPPPVQTTAVSGEFRQLMNTFLGGLVFVGVLIA